jgi:hypothetical protein
MRNFTNVNWDLQAFGHKRYLAFGLANAPLVAKIGKFWTQLLPSWRAIAFDMIGSALENGKP